MPLRERLLDHLKADWVLNLMGAVTVVVVLLTFLVILVFGPSLRSTTRSLDESQELTGCRSSYAAAVTDSRTAFDIARSDRDSIRTDADVVLLGLARAAVRGDESRVAELDRQVDALEVELVEAQGRVDTADADLLEANDTYQAAIEISRRDPSGFLDACDTAGL